jgi:hypothetical protein
MSAQLDFLRDPPPPDPAPPAPKPSTLERKQKARDIQVSGARRWIDAGKPIAIAVAKNDGKVTAASFRKAADALHALPNSYNNQRALGWISAMFNELVREGALEKARHENGAPVRVYGGRGNDQVVYRIPAGAK